MHHYDSWLQFIKSCNDPLFLGLILKLYVGAFLPLHIIGNIHVHSKTQLSAPEQQ